MEEKKPQRKRRDRTEIRKVRGLTGMAMGVIYILVGIYIIYAEQKGFFAKTDIPISGITGYLLFGLCVLYGGYRIWRGGKLRQDAIKEEKENQTS